MPSWDMPKTEEEAARDSRSIVRVAAALFIVALLLLAASLIVGASAAGAHLVRYPDHPKRSLLENRERSQRLNLAHAVYVCRHGGGAHRRWACWAGSSVVRANGQGWLRAELAKTRAALTPAWGPWAFPDPCLREISRRETVGTYSPTIWNYEGSGAYGIGQAKPASKMARFGRDYMTNPWTQLRWMVAYANGRYGSSCAALAFHNRNGWW